VSRTVARALRLNEYLAEAIRPRDDLGHPAIGSLGDGFARSLPCLPRFGVSFMRAEQSFGSSIALEREGALPV